MTDRDETGGSGPKEPGGGGSEIRSIWERLMQGGKMDAGELKELESEFEAEARKVFESRFGHLPLKADGTLDTSKLSQAELNEQAPELAVGVLASLSRVLEQHYGKASAPSGDRPKEVDQMQSDIGFLLGLLGNDPSKLSSDRLAQLTDRLKKAVSQKLHEELHLPLSAEGKVDVTALAQKAVQRDLGERLTQLLRAQARKVQAAREQRASEGAPGEKLIEALQDARQKIEATKFVARRAQKAAEAKAAVDLAEAEEEAAEVGSDTVDVVPDVSADGTPAAPEGTVEGGPVEPAGFEEEPGAGNVVFLEEFRRRIQEKREQMNQSVGERLTAFFESQLAGLTTGGQQPVSINLDQQFFQEYGPQMIQEVVKGLSKALQMPKIEITLPMAPQKAQPEAPAEAESSEEEGTSAASEGDAQGVKLSMKVDLASLFQRIFKKATGPKGEGTPTGEEGG